MAPGDTIRVRNWPNTQGERFRVQKVIPNIQDPSKPATVYAHRLEKLRGADGHGTVGTAFRAFPEDHCEVVKR